MYTIAMILVLIFGVYVFRKDGWRIIQAKRNGIETEACVSRIVEDKKAADGADYYRHFYYVTFQTEDGLQNEARLINPKGGLVTGSTVRIRYLPEKNDYAVMMNVIRT